MAALTPYTDTLQCSQKTGRDVLCTLLHTETELDTAHIHSLTLSFLHTHTLAGTPPERDTKRRKGASRAGNPIQFNPHVALRRLSCGRHSK